MNLGARVRMLEDRLPSSDRVEMPADPVDFLRAVACGELRWNRLDHDGQSRLTRLAALLIQCGWEREQLAAGHLKPGDWQVIFTHPTGDVK